MVTFTLVGSNKGKTVALGPSGRYRFVNGEMLVRDEDAGLLAKALSRYMAFPKGDADGYHLRACAKLGIDPDTLEPVGTGDGGVGGTPEVVEEESVDEIDVLAKIIAGIDHDNDECWTDAGLVSVRWVKSQLPDDSIHVTRHMVDEYNVVREGHEEEG